MFFLGRGVSSFNTLGVFLARVGCLKKGFSKFKTQNSPEFTCFFNEENLFARYT